MTWDFESSVVAGMDMAEANRRRTARNKCADWRFRDRVVAKHGYQCHHCGEELVGVWEIEPKRRIRHNWRFIFWVDRDGNQHKDLMLTLDHLLPISEGGNTSVVNCVPSCAVCNQVRNKKAPAIRACGRCGGVSIGKRHCPECRKILSEMYRQLKGGLD